MIKGELFGDAALIQRLAKFPELARPRLLATAKELAYELEAKIKGEYLRGPRPGKLGVRTGKLLSSIYSGVSTPTGEKIFIYAGTRVLYGIYWEQGIKAHTVTAKNKKTLHFIGHDGRDHFPRSVFIPAQKARPFLRPALVKMESRIRKRLNEAIRIELRNQFK